MSRPSLHKFKIIQFKSVCNLYNSIRFVHIICVVYKTYKRRTYTTKMQNKHTENKTKAKHRLSHWAIEYELLCKAMKK